MSNEYYGVPTTPTEDFIAHYGIRGMKWGVRRARMSGDAKKLSRAHEKAVRKLAKLDKQAAKSSKYAKRAIGLGIGAGAMGGLAAAGTTGVAKGIGKIGGATMGVSKAVGRGLTLVPGRNKISQALHRQGVAMYRAGERGSELHKKFADVSGAVNRWGNSTSLSEAAGRAVGNVHLPTGASRALTQATGNNMAGLGEKIKRSGVTNNAIARVGAGVIGAGLAAGAARNAYKAATAKKKAAKFRAEMNKAFAGTKYAGNYGASASKSKKRRGSRRG